MRTEISEKLFERAVRVMPGGVNSPVRAFGSVGGSPRFIERAKGARLYDIDGNEYTDYIGSWGPMILGHNDERVLEAVMKQMENGLSFGAATGIEVEMAELIGELVPCVEMIRMVNSGTEAVMSAIRAARGFTGRDKIIKFEGCYHGHADAMLVKAGSGVMTAGVPDSAGVPEGCARDTLTAEYNNLKSVEDLFAGYPGEIACIIVEPVAANMGVVTPAEGFLQGLRHICDKNGALLILDEVITGFRLGIDGAIGHFGVTPDLVTYGKIIGGGMPVGAYGGRRDIMSVVSPLGKVYQAGTLSGNPIAMRAGITQLNILRNEPQLYDRINALGERLRAGLRGVIEKAGLPYTVNGTGSLTCLYFSDKPVYDYATARAADTVEFAKYFRHMLNCGNYIGPSQFEAVFISGTHTEADIDKFIADAEEYFK
ncbi:MAG: glutamate-1-semialdehyde 2,1-aminomutase [Candidatus Ornithomonoglobus sp.]